MADGFESGARNVVARPGDSVFVDRPTGLRPGSPLITPVSFDKDVSIDSLKLNLDLAHTYPNLTAAQVRDMLMKTVEIDPDLRGKVSTGGKLDIAAAVAAAKASVPAGVAARQ